MNFKKGKPVEVLRRQDKSSGSWFPARIVSVDAQGYTVRFEHFRTAEGEQVVEKVHLVDLRPCPPITVNERGWVAGDIVEVFDLHSWRVGKVAKVLRNNRFVIGLLESIQLKEFHRSIVRDLQSWQDGKWVRIEKVDCHVKNLAQLMMLSAFKSCCQHSSHVGISRTTSIQVCCLCTSGINLNYRIC